ncbi:MAG: hypothetical protein JRJ12_01345 [Deltaproteobacteria bacterium]|nr:hypothetical protein [Deltaproteobacteria bacterium]MBW2070187.1 hypothetical protein [Deltaproteobacteria bacterium]
MKDVPPAVERLKELAENYRQIHQALQKRYSEVESTDDFVAELRYREASLLDRFRTLQQQLIASLQGEDLEQLLDLSRIFDEIRVINLFTIQALTHADREPPGTTSQVQP